MPGRLPRFLGPDHPVTLDASERLGAILWHLGKLDEAETILRKNVADRRGLLKAEHPDTLRSVYLLSRVLLDRGRFADAQTFADQYAHSVSCSMGINHPANVAALTNQGDFSAAKGISTRPSPITGTRWSRRGHLRRRSSFHTCRHEDSRECAQRPRRAPSPPMSQAGESYWSMPGLDPHGSKQNRHVFVCWRLRRVRW